MDASYRRLPAWPRLLAEFLAQRAAQSFTWGPNDCACFVADEVQAITGGDLLQELRGPRRTALQAARQIRAGGGIREAMRRAGLQAIAPALAQRGDVVMVAQGRHEVLAVCMGGVAMAPGLGGLESAPMARAVAAWRI